MVFLWGNTDKMENKPRCFILLFFFVTEKRQQSEKAGCAVHCFMNARFVFVPLYVYECICETEREKTFYKSIKNTKYETEQLIPFHRGLLRNTQRYKYTHTRTHPYTLSHERDTRPFLSNILKGSLSWL